VNRKKAIYWFRWLMLPPAVGSAFLMAGIAGALPAMFLNEEWGFVLAGPFCAVAWVVVAWATAPSHRPITALTAFCTGAFAAAALLLLFPFIEVIQKVVMFGLTCAGGLGALVMCLPKQERLKGIQHLKAVLENSVNTVQQKSIASVKKSMKTNETGIGGR